MAKYIEREYAVDAIVDVYYNTPDINLSCEKFEAAILKIPDADVAPVVRCKDCKHRHEDSWCEYVDDDDNFYCARGERKEGQA